MWEQDLAIELFRDLEPMLALVGWHAALGGSVMLKGRSAKDLDVVVYPHRRGLRRPSRKQLAWLHDACTKAGMHQIRTAARLKRMPQWRESGDQKHVEIWSARGGRRVDLFVLS